MVKDIRLGNWFHIDDHEDGRVTIGNDSNSNPNITYNQDGTTDIENLSGGAFNPDSIESQSVTTDSLSVKGESAQMALSGYIVPVSSTHGVTEAIDPDATTTPLQDAHDTVGQGGAILLPPRRITEESTFTWSNGNLSIYGWGEPSKVEFTDLANVGVDYQAVIRTEVDGVVFDGSDATNRTAPIWKHTGTNAQGQNFGRVWFRNGSDPVIDLQSAQPFSSIWKYVNFQGGSHTGRNILGKFGVGCNINNIYLAAANEVTGMDISGNVTIDAMNVGGAIGTAVDFSGGATTGHLSVSKINYETTGAPTAAVRLGSTPSASVESLHVTTGSPTYGVELYDSGGGSPANNVIGYVQPGNNIGTSRILLSAAMPTNSEFGNLYYGPSSGVTDNSGSANGTFRCLQDNTTLG